MSTNNTSAAQTCSTAEPPSATKRRKRNGQCGRTSSDDAAADMNERPCFMRRRSAGAVAFPVRQNGTLEIPLHLDVAGSMQAGRHDIEEMPLALFAVVENHAALRSPVLPSLGSLLEWSADRTAGRRVWSASSLRVDISGHDDERHRLAAGA